MPFALIFIGALAFVAAYKDTLPQLGALLKSDFSGPGNFMYWIVALVILGSLGNFTPFRISSKMLLLLVLVVMVISDKGFFAKFVASLNAKAPATTLETNAPEGQASGSGDSSGGSLANTAAEIAMTALTD
jgi:hypothetical protein